MAATQETRATWEWVRAFADADVPKDAKYVWTREPFALDGLAVATDTKTLVAVRCADALPAPPAKAVEMTRAILAGEKPGIELDRAALAEWAALPNDASGCQWCKGAGVVVHACNCELCKVETEPCSCQTVRDGRLLGGLIDRARLAKLLVAAPASDIVCVRYAAERFFISAGDWRAIISGQSPTDQKNVPEFPPAAGDRPPGPRGSVRKQ